MALRKTQHFSRYIASPEGERKAQGGFVQKADAFAADGLVLNPGVVEHEQTWCAGIVLKSRIGWSQGFFMHPKDWFAWVHQNRWVLGRELGRDERRAVPSRMAG